MLKQQTSYLGNISILHLKVDNINHHFIFLPVNHFSFELSPIFQNVIPTTNIRDTRLIKMEMVINLYIDCSIQIPRERISLFSSIIIVSFMKQFQNNVIFVIPITVFQTDNTSNGQFIILCVHQIIIYKID